MSTRLGRQLAKLNLMTKKIILSTFKILANTQFHNNVQIKAFYYFMRKNYVKLLEPVTSIFKEYVSPWEKQIRHAYLQRVDIFNICFNLFHCVFQNFFYCHLVKGHTMILFRKQRIFIGDLKKYETIGLRIN